MFSDKVDSMTAAPIAVGGAVAVGWIALALSRRWKHEAGWVERIGRALGCAAIGSPCSASWYSGSEHAVGNRRDGIGCSLVGADTQAWADARACEPKMRRFKKFPRCACLDTRLTVHSLMMTAVPVLALAIGEDLTIRRWLQGQRAARDYAIAPRLFRDQARGKSDRVRWSTRLPLGIRATSVDR